MNLRPLIGWLVLAAVMAGLLLPNKNVMFTLVAAAIALYILTSTARRYTLLLLPFALIGVLAPQFILPLPETWPGLVRLAITLAVWLLAAVSIAMYIVSAFSEELESNESDPSSAT